MKLKHIIYILLWLLTTIMITFVCVENYQLTNELEKCKLNESYYIERIENCKYEYSMLISDTNLFYKAVIENCNLTKVNLK